MKKTNFDAYLEAQLKEPGFAKRFKREEEVWARVMAVVVSLKRKKRKMYLKPYDFKAIL